MPRGRDRAPRGRIHQATIEVVSERGYPETRVIDVIGVAGVPRKTFYEFFEKQGGLPSRRLRRPAGQPPQRSDGWFRITPGAPWSEKAGDALQALLEHLAAHPAEARFAIVEVLAAGPKALARRDAALRQFTGFLEAGRSETSVELPVITSLAIAGGINELLYS